MIRDGTVAGRDGMGQDWKEDGTLVGGSVRDGMRQDETDGTGGDEMEQEKTEHDKTGLGDTERNGTARNAPEEKGTR